MHSSPHLLPVIAVSLGLLLTPTARAAEAEPAPSSAAELAGRLSEKEQDGTSYVRLRMEMTGPKKSAIQVQIKSRAAHGGTEMVYQILWPKERKGESVLLRRSAGRESAVLFAPPDQTRTLDAAQLREPLFGTDLSYEDVIDNFFAWDQQAIVGSETVDRVPCQILESKPGKAGHSTYGSVRSWIDTKRLVPLRIEKYGASGKLVRRIDTTRVLNDDQGRPVPAKLTVRGPAGDSVTELDGGKISHRTTFTDAEFTPEGIKKTEIPKGSAE